MEPASIEIQELPLREANVAASDAAVIDVSNIRRV